MYVCMYVCMKYFFFEKKNWRGYVLKNIPGKVENK
jgi:hypothetical protein